MATLFNTLCRLFSKPPRAQGCGPVTAAIRALHAEHGGR